MDGLTETDLSFEDTSIHLWTAGHGFPLIFLHGSGIGTSTPSNFKRVLGPLSKSFRVIAADLIGYGRSGLRPQRPYFDMELWQRQAQFLIDLVPDKLVGVIGHSLSGSLALRLAASNARVAGVITTGTTGTLLDHLKSTNRQLAAYPNEPSLMGPIVERTLHNKELATQEEINYRIAILNRPGYSSYLNSLLAEYRFDLAALSEAELQSIACPVLLMHGLQDASFTPEETSLPLARQLRNADVLVLANCAHSVALERPDSFITAVRRMFANT
jgi:2-hydroxymuconate-semialdehyde hydrolase